MSNPSIIVTVEANGKQVLRDVNLPLLVSNTRNNRYDLIASLQALPALKAYKFSRVRPVEVLSFESRGNVFDAESEDNFLTRLQFERMQNAVLKGENSVKGKIYELQLDDELKSYKCAMCPCDALHADVRLNMPFCSQTCWERCV